jgi:hypothetical protein
MYSLALIIFVVSEKKAFVQNASSLKPLGQLKPNCPGMIIGRFSTNVMFFMPIGNPRWSANQSILLALAAILNIRLERKTVTL